MIFNTAGFFLILLKTGDYDADMFTKILELAHEGLVDQASKHILATNGGHGFYKFDVSADSFVATPHSVWYRKFLNAARGSNSVKVNVTSPMFKELLPAVTAVAFEQGSDSDRYKVLLVNKLHKEANINVTVDKKTKYDANVERNKDNASNVWP